MTRTAEKDYDDEFRRMTAGLELEPKKKWAGYLIDALGVLAMAHGGLNLSAYRAPGAERD